jgi:hypothetical protein
MCNCNSNFSSFDGYDEYDEFIRSKAGKKRRKRKKELRDSGLSRKEARKQALAEIPRTKKKREAVKLAKQEARAEAEAISVMEAVDESVSPEIVELMEEGILSSDPSIASLEVAESIGKEEATSKISTMLKGGIPVAPKMTTMAQPPLVSMTPDPITMAMVQAEVEESNQIIKGVPNIAVYIGGAVVGFMLLKGVMGKGAVASTPK